jgi:hypothetical protein
VIGRNFGGLLENYTAFLQKFSSVSFLDAPFLLLLEAPMIILRPFYPPEGKTLVIPYEVIGPTCEE